MRTLKDSTGLYLDEIGRVPLLDAAQERDLAQQIEAGRAAQARLDAGDTGPELRRAVRAGARAKDRFIRANLRLVVSMARRYPLPPSMELLDLIQEGNLGLEHAVDKFDWRKGFKFSTYASFWIRQAIGRALDQKGSLIRIPGDRSAELRAALRATGGAAEQLDPDLAELHRLTALASLDKPIGEDGDDELGDLLAGATVGPEDQVVAELHDELVTSLLESLEPVERRAVELRMGMVGGRARSFREIGEELGLSDEGARRMVKRVLRQLRDDAEALGLAA
ncbi:MAG TPA: sigma-70 family RNA polymerase sigma factor [Acidimicrobiales bacterium]|nr:sigma-70 family RNA polymerase sigma factor [Acidimicrobiales bacterium]